MPQQFVFHCYIKNNSKKNIILKLCGNTALKTNNNSETFVLKVLETSKLVKEKEMLILELFTMRPLVNVWLKLLSFIASFPNPTYKGLFYVFLLWLTQINQVEAGCDALCFSLSTNPCITHTLGVGSCSKHFNRTEPVELLWVGLGNLHHCLRTLAG